MNSAREEQNAKALEARLREHALLSRVVANDRLMLADATLLAALNGSRALTPNERQALKASPLTLRRFRHLSLERHRVPKTATSPAANDAHWIGSIGMETLVTDDNYWTLHFLPQDGAWQVILSLSAQAPFAARLLSEQTQLRVIDGGGAIVLQGRLDTDGECECAWPFDTAPAPHFHLYGASFAVEPVAT